MFRWAFQGFQETVISIASKAQASVLLLIFLATAQINTGTSKCIIAMTVEDLEEHSPTSSPKQKYMVTQVRDIL